MKNKLKCILLIDDNFHDNFFHQIAINELDITEKILLAADGFEALDLLKAKNACIPDLIFLDINMPRMNGWEFLDAYKEIKHSLKSKIIIVMLTTSSNPSDKKKADICEDLCGYTTKPLNTETLSKIIHEHFPEVHPLEVGN
ncbi:MAG: response regulator [Bacteroidota bacterium]|nr:response regulator [Bacteroidota bacterium]